MHDAGISKAGDLVDLGVDWELIEACHGVYSYRGAILGRGKRQAICALHSDPALAGEIEKRVRQAAGVPVLDGPVSLPLPATASAGLAGVR